MANPAQPNGKESALHHFIQKAYLNRFALDGKIDVISRVDGQVRCSQPTNKVAAIKGFYNAHLEDGTLTGAMEDALESDVEEPANTQIGNLCSLFPYVPRGEQRSALASYMALQFVRTPESRRRLEQQTTLHFRVEAFNTARNRDEIKRILASKGKDTSEAAIDDFQSQLLKTEKSDYELIPSYNYWIQYVVSGMKTLYATLVKRYNWQVIVFDDHSLITGDHPIILRKIVDDGRGVGFANADEVLFPLSTKVLLLLSADPDVREEVIRPANPSRLSEMVNSSIVGNSYAEFYCHPSLTTKYEGNALGVRPNFEVGGSHKDLPRFFRQFGDAPKRLYPKR